MAGQGTSMELQHPYTVALPGELTSILLGLCSCLITILSLALLVKLCLRQRCPGCWAADDHLIIIGTILIILSFAVNCYVFLRDSVTERSDVLPPPQAFLIAVWAARWMKDLTTIFARLPIFLLCMRSLKRVACIQMLARAGAICTVILWGSLSISRLAMTSPRAGQSWQAAVDNSTASEVLVIDTISSSLDTFTSLYILVILCIGTRKAKSGTAIRSGLVATTVTACFSLVASIIALASSILAGTRQKIEFAQAGTVSSLASNQISLLSACMPALATVLHGLLQRWRVVDKHGQSMVYHLTKSHRSTIDNTHNNSYYSLRDLSQDGRVGSENWLSAWDYLPPPPRIWSGASDRRVQDRYTRYGGAGGRHIFARDQRPPCLSPNFSSSNTALIPPSSRKLQLAVSNRAGHNELLGDRILVETDITIEESRAALE